MSESPSPVALLVYCSCPPDSADALATALVHERLAACVSAMPGVRSTYRWNGHVEQDEECLLLIKTHPDRLEALVQRARELHPYELPELVAVEIRGGLDPYLHWVAEQTRIDD